MAEKQGNVFQNTGVFIQQEKRDSDSEKLDSFVFRWFVSKRSYNIPLDGTLRKIPTICQITLATMISWHRMDGLCVGNKGKQKQTVLLIIISYNSSMSQVLLKNINGLLSPSKLQSAWNFMSPPSFKLMGFPVSTNSQEPYSCKHAGNKKEFLQNFQSYQVANGNDFNTLIYANCDCPDRADRVI